MHIDSLQRRLRNDAVGRICVIFGLITVFAVVTVTGEPALPNEDLIGTPPSGQIFRAWSERQRFARQGAQLAPGAPIIVEESNKPVRVPFFVITVKDSPTDLVQNKSAIVAGLKKRLF